MVVGRLRARLLTDVNNVMKKQYTREQIVEAIRYWESVLKRIDEA